MDIDSFGGWSAIANFNSYVYQPEEGEVENYNPNITWIMNNLGELFKTL